MRRQLEVTPDAGGLRLDAFLARSLPCSASAARRLIAGGMVTVDGRSSAKGARVQPGQRVEVDVDEGSAAPIPAPGMELRLLFEDAGLVAIDKPAGVPSHPLRPGETGTVANALVARYPECAAASPDPREGGLGHRLDRDTSGVLLAARSRRAWEALRASLSAPDCEKIYLAEVAGVPAVAGAVDLPIGQAGRSSARVRLESGRGLLPAHTEWQLVEARGATALVRARLHAGRRHQVRVHLASVGHPIVGDELYATETSRAVSAQLGAGRMRLHAESIRLRHPTTGAPLVITAPLPPWA